MRVRAKMRNRNIVPQGAFQDRLAFFGDYGFSINGQFHLTAFPYLLRLSLYFFTLLVSGKFAAAAINRRVTRRTGAQAHAAPDADSLVDNVRLLLLAADGHDRAHSRTGAATAASVTVDVIADHRRANKRGTPAFLDVIFILIAEVT
jgi:hypothetical protein